MKLSEIVSNRDLSALEAFCQRRTYREVIAAADKAGISRDEIEELLAAI